MKKLHMLLFILSILLVIYEIILMILYKDIAQSKLVCLLAAILAIYSYLYLIDKMPRLITILVFLVLASFIFIEGNVLYYSFDHTKNKHYDTIIVLGAQVRGNGPSEAFKYRINKAKEYLEKDPDTLIIASGGQGYNESMSEAKCIEENIGECKNLILEEKSTSTEENLEYSKEYIQGDTAIISNSFHLYRVHLIANRLNMKVDLIPAKNHKLTYVHFLIREYFGVLIEYTKAYL